MKIIRRFAEKFLMPEKASSFGLVYIAYSRKSQIAVNFLLRKKQGEIPNAIYNKRIGWIDVVWGYEGTGSGDGYGLAKIVKFHPEVVRKLAKVIRNMTVASKSGNRYKLESTTHFAAVSRVWFEDQKTWLLTVFEKKTR